jgi:hypothetical protein
MPCYDPIPSKNNEMFHQWLCQAFKMLTTKQIKSIKGILEGWEKQTAYEWFLQHRKDEE